MNAGHLEILVEEPSMEAFLSELLPRLFAGRATFSIHPHQGKHDLLKKLPGRLRGYANWLQETMRVVVLVDRDESDCRTLKLAMEEAAEAAGLLTRAASGGTDWQVVNRLAIEELEAWFFGEWTAVKRVYPRVPTTIPQQAPYRQPDAIAGGTWEALHRIPKRAGYFSGGFRKMEAAKAIGKEFDTTRACSPSFIAFRDAILETMA